MSVTRGYRVTVTMTALQAIQAEHALTRAAVGTENGRLYGAATRIRSGLYEAGWDTKNVGTEDEPKWVWEHPNS